MVAERARAPTSYAVPPFTLMMCSQLRVQMVASGSMPWPHAKRHCVARQYTESACRGASITSFASHDAAVMCFSPGPRVCVVYTIRLASSESGRLFFPFWMSRSSSRRRRRRSVIAFGFGRPLGLQSIAAFRWKWALQLCEAVLGQSEVDFTFACLGVRLYSCVRVSVSLYERVRLREPERPCVRV